MDLHDLGVARVAVADLTVAGVVHVTAGITGFHRVHSLDLIINSFQTPETSPGQCCGLKIGVHTITPSLTF
jgi:hypothetical protein